MTKLASMNRLETYSKQRALTMLITKIVIGVFVPFIFWYYLNLHHNISLESLTKPLVLSIFAESLLIFLNNIQGEDKEYKWNYLCGTNSRIIAAKIMKRIPPDTKVIKYLHNKYGDKKYVECELRWVEVVEKDNETKLVIYYHNYSPDSFYFSGDFPVRIAFLDSTVTIEQGGLRQIFLPVVS